MRIKKPEIKKIQVEVSVDEIAAIHYAMKYLDDNVKFDDPNICFFTTGGKHRCNQNDIRHIRNLTENFLDTYR